MYRASRDLIKSRMPFCEIEPRLVAVERIPRLDQQDCFMNAYEHENVDIFGSGSTSNELISGWIVYPMDPVQKSTEIIQHWWNYDPVARRFFDTTTFNEEVASIKVDYIADVEIKNGGMKRFSEIASNVGKDLFYVNGIWHVTEFAEDGTTEVKIISNLSIDNILYFK